MATFYSDVRTNDNASPTVKNKTNRYGGRVRALVATYTAPATGMPAIGDVIEWGTLPVFARVLGGASKLYWSAGTASSTLNVGDSTTAARYLADTAISSAGNATVEAANANGGTFEVTTAGAIQSVVAGAGIAASQVITLQLLYVVD